MRISTGLLPEAVRQVVPRTDRTAPRITQEDYAVTLPLPSYRTEDVWIIRFTHIWRYMDGEVERGEVMQTMLSATEPKIEKMSVSFTVLDEHPKRQEVIDHYRERHSIPADAMHQAHHHESHRVWDYRYDWFEVTL